MTAILPTISAPHDPGGLGGLIALIQRAEVPMPLDSVRVRTHIMGNFATSIIEQRFKNGHHQPIKAVRVFPLHRRAALPSRNTRGAFGFGDGWRTHAGGRSAPSGGFASRDDAAGDVARMVAAWRTFMAAGHTRLLGLRKRAVAKAAKWLAARTEREAIAALAELAACEAAFG